MQADGDCETDHGQEVLLEAIQIAAIQVTEAVHVDARNVEDQILLSERRYPRRLPKIDQNILSIAQKD